jgi:hypothetical protein
MARQHSGLRRNLATRSFDSAMESSEGDSPGDEITSYLRSTYVARKTAGARAQSMASASFSGPFRKPPRPLKENQARSGHGPQQAGNSETWCYMPRKGFPLGDETLFDNEAGRDNSFAPNDVETRGPTRRRTLPVSESDRSDDSDHAYLERKYVSLKSASSQSWKGETARPGRRDFKPQQHVKRIPESGPEKFENDDKASFEESFDSFPMCILQKFMAKIMGIKEVPAEDDSSKAKRRRRNIFSNSEPMTLLGSRTACTHVYGLYIILIILVAIRMATIGQSDRIRAR